MAANSGKRVKMVIEAYEQPDFTSSAGDFSLQMNPEKYDISVPQKTYEKKNVLSNGEVAPGNDSEKLEVLTFDFYLDATGIVPGCTDVHESIEKLRKLGLEINGKIHRKNYLKVRWDSVLVFPCVMKSLEVDYLLFKPDGTPVRAKLSAEFEQFIDAETQAKINNTSSPDLTHVHTVVAGDNLPLLCYKIYGDSKYYLQVAEYNDIINLSCLNPGQKIIFPPLSYGNISSK
ncbi:LysM peptidoglycan-binding domain-containing protein [Fulvivirga maritima]|uniref:CIS tube protein n=1 Tax=Fulvivirga maritima TaxID=2904247 RepID=UPI001F3A9C69|nr:LysM peptidoglycan-binding domain-containing protein [Fulvivirga maritima]UII27383.1 LysM peptidoglycan-binding domain-containing protein [Fulvivirga maritima]